MIRVKEESEKTGLKLNIQKTSIMASGLITSWQIVGGKVETVKILLSWAPKSLWVVISAMKLKDVCSWKESYDKLTQHIKKQRLHFADKGLCSQSYGFPAVTYGCESWTIKKAEP